MTASSRELKKTYVIANLLQPISCQFFGKVLDIWMIGNKQTETRTCKGDARSGVLNRRKRTDQDSWRDLWGKEIKGKFIARWTYVGVVHVCLIERRNCDVNVRLLHNIRSVATRDQVCQTQAGCLKTTKSLSLNVSKNYMYMSCIFTS